MQIRPLQLADIAALDEIDGTIESAEYLHLERSGEGLAVAWRLEERTLRSKRIEANRLADETRFFAKHVAEGIEEGIAQVAEKDGVPVALLLARVDHEREVMRIVELRVDFDHRRQGLASAMLFGLIGESRNLELRAVAGETRTNNLPASRLLSKCGFDLAGVDSARHTNYDLVKESATLFWYAALD
ncbi:MAG TPA: GNAT family N-acetyltransferase [Tepidisphaeraceae bacterium]|jgi:RimJ/RimL family protein N-acetyltransferase|nr:GNAT family N-acetyltransferase [Tepidisphaeraceae bacterium]